MTPYALIVDDFFYSPKVVRERALSTKFEDVTSPVDGVVYPDLNIKVAQDVQMELYFKINKLLDMQIKRSTIFFRLSKKDIKQPHQAHTDAIMGQYTALVYLNPEYPDGYGTSLLSHMPTDIKELRYSRTWDYLGHVEQRNSNDSSKWGVDLFIPAKFNRMVLIDSTLFHRAEPIGGFGDTNENGRLVLIGFFDAVIGKDG